MTRDRKERSQSGLVVWFGQHGAVALTIMGLAVYAVVRIAVDSFYQNIGITAEDVGLNQGSIIGRSALSLVIVGLFCVFVASFIACIEYLFVRLAQRVIIRRRSGRSRVLLIRMTTGEIVSPWAVAYSVGVFGLLMILTYFDIDYHEARSPSQEFLHRNVIKFIPIAMILSVIGYALHSITIPHGRRGNRSFRASAWICAAALIGGLIVTWATGTGEKMASDIRNGETSRQADFISNGANFTFLPIKTECVALVRVKSGAVPVDRILPARAIYLGQANNILLLYSPGRGTLQLPASEFALSYIGSSGCRK